MTTDDPYAPLMERLNFPHSERFRRILQKLVTAEEAALLLQLPAEPPELARQSGLDEQTCGVSSRNSWRKGWSSPPAKDFGWHVT